MPKVTHFEISANEPEKVIPFYEKIFGWKTTKLEGPVEYWAVQTGPDTEPGIDGGFFRPNEWFSGTVNTIEVTDLDEYLDKVRHHGGEVVTEKMTIPGVGYLAYCKDVEGTLFGLTERDPGAGGWRKSESTA